MLVDEIATYLAGAGLSLTVAQNLFTAGFPATAPEDTVVVALTETDGEESIESFGPSLQAPDVERPEFLVIVRSGKDDVEGARAKAFAVYKKLRNLGPTTLSGTLYHDVKARPPKFLGGDESGRPVYEFACSVWKEESAA